MARRLALCDCAAMRLRELREAKGLSLKQLADQIGMTVPTVLRAERMDKTAKLETYVKCADALGVELDDLFNDQSDLDHLILDAFRSLPQERQQGWIDMARAVLAERQK